MTLLPGFSRFLNFGMQSNLMKTAAGLPKFAFPSLEEATKFRNKFTFNITLFLSFICLVLFHHQFLYLPCFSFSHVPFQSTCSKEVLQACSTLESFHNRQNIIFRTIIFLNFCLITTAGHLFLYIHCFFEVFHRKFKIIIKFPFHSIICSFLQNSIEIIQKRNGLAT